MDRTYRVRDEEQDGRRVYVWTCDQHPALEVRHTGFLTGIDILNEKIAEQPEGRES